jgi:LysM repeat protein
VTHIVQRGENLSSISTRYGTTVAAIQRANGLRGTLIRAGQRLSIVAGAGATRASGRTATSATAVASNEPVSHVVGRGENLSSISTRYGTTVAAIQRANGLRGTLIRAGQRLSIPGGTRATRASSPAATSATAVASSEPVTHVVGRGENLSSISTRYGTTVAAIQRANGLRGTLIRAGQRLSMPGGTAATRASSRAATSATAVASNEPVTHVVGRGENLSSISTRYGTTVAAIQRANGLRGTLIRAGQRLSMPGGTAATRASSRAATSATAVASNEPVTHVVRRGENLSSISQRYGATVAAVRRANGLRGTVIQPGQRLSIVAGTGTAPSAAATSSTTAPRAEEVTHVVRRGENLSSISQRYGTTVAAVRRANGLRGTVIRPGQRLAVVTTRPGARWSASLSGLRFRVNERGEQVPDVRAEAAIIYNPATGQVLWEENAQSQRSIASITKIMTAVVFLEGSPDLSAEAVIERADVRRASTTHLRAGYTVSHRNLLHLLLIASDNAAARALARVSPHGKDGFVARMNEKAAELGLTNTQYVEPSGLLSGNVSSAYDMARLLAYAAGDNRISDVMQKQRHDLSVGRRTISIRSTNQLVRTGDIDVLGGKTGFIRRAGYCLATLLRLPEGGPSVVVVVLGARSSASRFLETRQLYSWLASKAQELLGSPVEAATVATGS